MKGTLQCGVTKEVWRRWLYVTSARCLVFMFDSSAFSMEEDVFSIPSPPVLQDKHYWK